MFDAEVLLTQLSALGRQLDDQVEELANLDLTATGKSCTHAELKEAYEDALAAAYIHADGSTIDERKAQARLKAQPARVIAQEAQLEAEQAKSKLRSQQARLKVLHTRVEIGRSLLSHQKMRMELDRLPEPR